MYARVLVCRTSQQFAPDQLPSRAVCFGQEITCQMICYDANSQRALYLAVQS